MDEFRIVLPNVKHQADAYTQMESVLKIAGDNTRGVRQTLRTKIGNCDGISRRLRQIEEVIEKDRKDMMTMQNSLRTITSYYEKTENSILSQKVEQPNFSQMSGGSTAGLTAGEESGADTGKTEDGKIFGEISSGAVIAGEISGKGTIGDIEAEGKLSGDILGYSAETSVKSGMSYKYNEKTGKYELDSIDLIKASASGEVHLAQGSAEGRIGLAYGSAEGVIGQVSAEGSVGISLWEDGQFAPQANVELSAEATAVSGKAEAGVGSDDNNVHVGADGKALTAEAKAEAGVGKITYEDSKGNTVSGWGAKAEAGAEAYLAEGEVSGGVTIFGVKIDVTLGGKIGGAGVSAGGHVTTGGVGGNISLGALIGGEIGIDIDWSGFKMPWS